MEMIKRGEIAKIKDGSGIDRESSSKEDHNISGAIQKCNRERQAKTINESSKNKFF